MNRRARNRDARPGSRAERFVTQGWLAPTAPVQPVEGQIVQVIKGGYEVKIGQARGFCPHSQVDIHREEEPERKVGETYQFRIMQLRRGGEDVVLSRRALLEEGRVEEAKAVRATLLEDAVMQGHVVGTAKFGAFVDLGAGVQGLVHISELAHQRVHTVEEAVSPGDTVRVKILKLHEESGRISLSIRQAEEDPWAEVAEKFQAGQTYPGTIRRMADFGAFVELATGVEALAPASEFPPSPGGWNEGLDLGLEREWMVLSVDQRARRVSVALPGEGAGATGDLAVGADLEGKIQRIERYGVFVWLGPGRVGLLPRAWTGAGESADLRRQFAIGDPVEVSVIEVSEDGRRIRLAKKGVKIEPDKKRQEQSSGSRRDLDAHQAADESGTFGTSLADKLRAALGQSEND